MNKFKKSLCVLSLVGASALLVANSAVHYDENGVGFVGKGDVQSLFDWNNSMMQENAHLVQFRFMSAGTVYWYCTWTTGPASNQTVHIQKRPEVSIGVNGAVAYDARRNRNGQVTGFILHGVDEYGNPDYAELGSCGGPTHVLVPDSFVYSYDSGEPVLQVSVDGIDWYTLSLTE